MLSLIYRELKQDGHIFCFGMALKVKNAYSSVTVPNHPPQQSLSLLCPLHVCLSPHFLLFSLSRISITVNQIITLLLKGSSSHADKRAS